MSNNPTRIARVEKLLDDTLDQLEEKVQKGQASAALLREVVKVAQAVGVDLANDDGPKPGQPGHDPILESMSDIDPELLR